MKRGTASIAPKNEDLRSQCQRNFGLCGGWPGSSKVERLFNEALQKQNLVLISAMNWGEVFYSLGQHRGEQKARETLANLSRLPLQLLPVDLTQTLRAAEIKAIHKIPFVDCLAAALAILQKAVLVTSDRDFQKLGRHFPILWLPRP